MLQRDSETNTNYRFWFIPIAAAVFATCFMLGVCIVLVYAKTTYGVWFPRAEMERQITILDRQHAIAPHNIPAVRELPHAD
jgi:hypothetical protein